MQESFRFLRIQSPDRFFCRIGLASCLAGHLRLSKKHSHAHQGEKHDAGNECFHGQDPFPSSKSSIKGDVKKKVLPRPESRFVSRDPAHFPSASLGRFCLLILISFSATGDDADRFLKLASTAVVRCQSGRRRRAYALASVRRSNCTCRFPAYSFHEDSYRDANEGINPIKLTSPCSR